MLAKIYLINDEYHIFFANSTQRKLTPPELKLFLETFNDSTHYGDSSDSQSGYGILTPSIGTLVAHVTTEKELVVLSPDFFHYVFQMDTLSYLTIEEYAAKVGRKPNMIGKLCRTGRLAGAHQQGGRWLIPSDAPYPVTK